jgi:hypothetical protein
LSAKAFAWRLSATFGKEFWNNIVGVGDCADQVGTIVCSRDIFSGDAWIASRIFNCFILPHTVMMPDED